MLRQLLPILAWLVLLMIQVIQEIQVIQQSSFNTCPYSMHTSLAILLLVLPSPLLPHTTHSHFIISVSKEAISQLFHLFLGLRFLKSNVKVSRHHQHFISGNITH